MGKRPNRRYCGNLNLGKPFMTFIVCLAILLMGYMLSKIHKGGLLWGGGSTMAVCVGCYFAGYIGGKNPHKSGALTGAICGVFLFLTVMILNILFNKILAFATVQMKIFLGIFCASVGGIFGMKKR